MTDNPTARSAAIPPDSAPGGQSHDQARRVTSGDSLAGMAAGPRAHRQTPGFVWLEITGNASSPAPTATRAVPRAAATAP
jgi:hypothetical protein